MGDRISLRLSRRGQRTFDERFEGIGRSGATDRALAFFADLLARGRATRVVARDLGVPEHYLIKNQKRQAHGYRSWFAFRGQMLWAFGEVVDPFTGEIRPLRSLPRGVGASWFQPQFT